MKESYGKGVANHLGPEPCEGGPLRPHWKRWTGVYVGWVWSSEIRNAGCRGRQAVRKATPRGAPARAPRDLAESKTPSMHRNSTGENRETLSPPGAERRRAGGRKR